MYYLFGSFLCVSLHSRLLVFSLRGVIHSLRSSPCCGFLGASVAPRLALLLFPCFLVRHQFVTNRSTNVTRDKRYHCIYVMSQRQTDTQNTKSNIPPVWKTVGMNRGVQIQMYANTPELGKYANTAQSYFLKKSHRVMQ